MIPDGKADSTKKEKVVNKQTFGVKFGFKKLQRTGNPRLPSG